MCYNHLYIMQLFGDCMTVNHLITQFDLSILDYIYQNIRCDFLDPVMAWLSYFSSKGIGWIIIGLILLIPRKTRRWGAMALFAMLIGFLLGELITKNLICRVRPFHNYELFHGEVLPFTLNAGAERGYSFPSGHTCCSFASATVYFKMDKRVGIPALILAFFIGFSRLYNYVHYPTDVAAGMILGIACGVFTIWLFNKYKLRRNDKVEDKNYA